MKRNFPLLFTLLLLILSAGCHGQATTTNQPLPVKVSDAQQSVLSLPLVQRDDSVFSYLGKFRIPKTFVGDDGRAGGGYAVSRDGVYMYASSFFGSIAKYRIPDLNQQAQLVFGWKPVRPEVRSDSKVHSALIEYENALYRTQYAAYVTAPEKKWIQKGSTNGENFTSLYRISGVDNARRLAQGFMHIPAEWQALLGGSVAVLGSRLSIISNAQNGYGFAVFNPEDIGNGNRVEPLLDYPFSHPIEPRKSGYNSLGGADLFSQTNAPLAGALIAPGSRSLLFITTHGYGPSGPKNSRCRRGSSVSNDPYRLQVVAYDLKDLVAVRSGKLRPHQVKPYDWWEWNGGGVHWRDCVGAVPLMPGFGVFDPANSRWYMDAYIQDGEIYVWEVNSQ